MTCPDCNHELLPITAAPVMTEYHWCANCGGLQVECNFDWVEVKVEFMRPLLSKYREGEK